MKKQNKKKNKKPFFMVIGCVLIIMVMIVGSFYTFSLFQKERDQVNKIKEHYDHFVSVTPNAKIYQKIGEDYQSTGEFHESSLLELESTFPVKSKDCYFKVAFEDFYVYYEDVSPVEERSVQEVSSHFLPFSSTLPMELYTFYQQENAAFTVLNNQLRPILYADDTYYYVSFFGDIYGVLKTDVEIDLQASEGEEATFVSTLQLEKENESCVSRNCISENRANEIFTNLQSLGGYTISYDTYLSWLKGDVRLQKGAFLLLTDSFSDLLSAYSFSSVSSNDLLRTTNKTNLQGQDETVWNVYSVSEKTSEEDILKMMQGEEVVIPVSKPSTSLSYSLPSEDAVATSIAVLNYHFFYDGSIGEQCDGGNCMDVKQFREQLDFLKENHYKTLTIEEYRAWKFQEITLPARSVLITIDDGAMGTGAHNGNKLIPILEEYDMHATLFLISGWWNIENYRSPNLDVESHTYDMHKEGICSNQTRGAQMLCSSYADVLKDLEWSAMQTGSKKAFCFPFYAYNDTAIQALKEVGFQMAFVGGYRKSTQSDNPYTIPRYPVHSTTTMSQFIHMIA